MRLIFFSSAALTLLTASTAIAPDFFYFLPLGGSAIAEVGIVLGIAVAIVTMIDVMKSKR